MFSTLVQVYANKLKHGLLRRRRSECEPNEFRAEAAKLKKFSDSGGLKVSGCPTPSKTHASGCLRIYPNRFESWFPAAPDIPIFGSGCIAQLFQVGLLLQRCAALNLRRRLCQILNFRNHLGILRRSFLLGLLCLGGCAVPSVLPRPFADGEKVHVLSTLAMIHDLVQEIGGEYVQALPLISGELNPHTYELVKGDDEKFTGADLIFYNGLGLEHGLSLRHQLEGNPKAYAVTRALLEQQPHLILRREGQSDPHVWMDIALWATCIDPIVTALSAQDPRHADYYHARAKQLEATLHEADQAVYQQLQAVPSEKRYLVTSHDAFGYFTRHYLADPGETEWELRCQAPEGLSPEAQMSVSDIVRVLAHIERFGITVLFPESNVNRDALKKILDASAHKGHPLRLCTEPLYGDAMGEAASYLDMIRHNARVIAEALSGDREGKSL